MLHKSPIKSLSDGIFFFDKCFGGGYIFICSVPWRTSRVPYAGSQRADSIKVHIFLQVSSHFVPAHLTDPIRRRKRA